MLLAILERIEALPSFFFLPAESAKRTIAFCATVFLRSLENRAFIARQIRGISLSLSLSAYFKGLTNTVAAFWPWYRSPSHNAARWRYRARKKNSYFTAIYKKLDFQIRSQERPRPRAWEQHCGEERGKKRKEEN